MSARTCSPWTIPGIPSARNTPPRSARSGTGRRSTPSWRGQGIRRQDFGDGQPPFQAGFFWDGNPVTLQAFRTRLAALNQFHILPSYDEYIDMLPNPLRKGKAVEFLQKELSFDAQRVVLAGDLGNDREMFETQFKGILPANALEELKAVACQAPWHYHSALPAGAGGMDGLCHFGFLKNRKANKKRYGFARVRGSLHSILSHFRNFKKFMYKTNMVYNILYFYIKYSINS